MVMTYVLDSDLRRSAKFLDNNRLTKQIVEAKQIFNLLIDIRILADIFLPYLGPMPINASVERRTDWIKQLAQLYKKSSTVTQPSGFYIIRTDTVFFILSRNDVLNIDIPNARIVKLGWVYHPTLRMWLGYENALTEYINIHIDEYYLRGGQSYIPRLSTHLFNRNTVLWPSWTKDPDCYSRHRSKIHSQELEKYQINMGIIPIPTGTRAKRDCYSWYAKIPEFTTSKPFSGYIWY